MSRRRASTATARGDSPPTVGPRRLALFAFLACVAIGPFLFGAVHPWAYGLLTLVVLAALTLLGVSGRVRLSLPGLLLLVLPAVGLAQLLPLPRDVVATLMPGRTEAAAALAVGDDLAASPTGALLAAELDTDAAAVLSHAPDATAREIGRYLLFACAFLVAASALRTTRDIRQIGVVAGATGGALALFGLVQAFLWNGKIYGVVPVPPGAWPYGPYINPNHFGGFLELTLPFCLAWLLLSLTEGRSSVLSAAVAALLALLHPAAILGSGSRGAFLSMLVGLAVTATLLAVALPRLRVTLGLVFAAALVAGLYFANIDQGQGFGRVTRGAVTGAERLATGSYAYRVEIWKSTLAMIRHYPAVGVGLGAFEETFPRFKPEVTGERSTYHGESDFLTMAAEGGALLMLPLLLVALLTLRRVLRGIVTARRGAVESKEHAREAWIWWSAAVGAVASLVGHGLVDINLQVPANALVFAAALALVLRTDPGDEDGRHRAAWPSRLLVAALLPVAALPIGRRVLADWHFQADRRTVFSGGDDAARGDRLDAVLRWEPDHAEARYRRGLLRSEAAIRGPRDGRRAAGEAALSDLAAACRVRPARHRHVFALGWLAARLAWLRTPPEPALGDYGEGLLRHASELNPTIRAYRYSLAYYLALIAPGRLQEGLGEMRAALSVDPDELGKVLEVLEAEFPAFLVSRAVPDTYAHRFAYAVHLERSGWCDAAVQQYLRTLALARPFPGEGEHYRRRIAARLQDLGQHQLALGLWAEVLAEAPNDPTALRRLARSVRGTGDSDGSRAMLAAAAAAAAATDPEESASIQAERALWTLSDGDPRRALVMLKDVEMTPQVMDVLALIHESRGEPGRAHRILTRLCRSHPEASSCARIDELERKMGRTLAGG